MYYYSIFGLAISSPISFSWPLEKIACPAHLDCEISQTTELISGLESNLFYTSSLINPRTSQPNIQIFSSAQGIILSCPGLGNFSIQPDSITYYLYDKDQSRFEAVLFRAVLILWLELIGVPVLHASGVIIRGTAIGFLANSKSGKSTLAAAFVHNGDEFLADDIFPVEAQLRGYLARPSYAWLRLLPEAAKVLGYQADQNEGYSDKYVILPNRNYGKFFPPPTFLAMLYLPERKDNVDMVSIETLPPIQAYLGLLQHSFAGKWLARSPLASRRMEFLAKLVKDIQVKRLIYPSGYEHLPAVVESVKRDLGL